MSFKIQILYIHETDSVNYKNTVVLYEWLTENIDENYSKSVYTRVGVSTHTQTHTHSELILTTNFYNNRKTLLGKILTLLYGLYLLT